MIYLSTAIGLTPGGSSTVHIYTQTIHRTTQILEEIFIFVPRERDHLGDLGIDARIISVITY